MFNIPHSKAVHWTYYDFVLFKFNIEWNIDSESKINFLNITCFQKAVRTFYKCSENIFPIMQMVNHVKIFRTIQKTQKCEVGTMFMIRIVL